MSNYPIYPNVYKKNIEFEGNSVNITIGKFSEQASASVLVEQGGTAVHTVAVLGKPSNIGYFPLQVEYFEKLYASGIIKGSRWIKREGKPSDDNVLKARVIDRSIRPLFPDGFKNEVQVINTVFSFDGEHEPDMLALLGTSIALAVSQIPFEGHMSGIRLVYKKGKQGFLVNPTVSQREDADLDIIISGNEKSIVMVEAGANEVTEDIIISSMSYAQKVLGDIVSQIEDIVKDVGKQKIDFESDVVDYSDLEQFLMKNYLQDIDRFIDNVAFLRPSGIDEFIEQNSEQIQEEFSDIEDIKTALNDAIFNCMKKRVRQNILESGKRPDGRTTEEIRPIWCEVDLFKNTHGSAMFKRGATQVCSITTLASPSLGQYIEDLEGQDIRHYIHHYNMPPYASGEVGRFGSPKRREIGHGALAERALLPVIPPQEEFPYTIRVVSEVLSSNGSTSQASVCGSTMSLMAAGVPIKKPVSGIAMGLISDGEKYVVLSDIQGLEDHVGDMDFKVAGTKDGVTAIQMDIKLKGIPFDVLSKALKQARQGRLYILEKMLAVIDKPREKISEYAPKIRQIVISTSKIGDIIGTGGKIIKSIIEKTGAQISIDDLPGQDDKAVVNITASDEVSLKQAEDIVKALLTDIKVGDEYDGVVTRIEPYGAFIEYLPSKEGLVHISNISDKRLSSVNDVLSVGDKVHVRVSEIKDDGKVQLSMLTPEQERQKKSYQAKNFNNKKRFNSNHFDKNFKKHKNNFKSRLVD